MSGVEPDAWSCICGRIDPDLYVKAADPVVVSADAFSAALDRVAVDEDMVSIYQVRDLLAALGIEVTS